MIKLSVKNKKLTNSGLLIPKDTLNPAIWSEMEIDPEVESQLKAIAEDILENIEIPAEIKDITITGSSASYNWHKLSDIDLHILLDFKEIDENLELVKRMLDQTRINWNKSHNIFIRGHEVELYFQDINEPHMANGIWSITKSEWEKEPEKKDVDLDLSTAEKKAECIAKAIDHATELFEKEDFIEAHEYAGKIKKKISNMRRSGLEKEGIYSPENLAFKMLRNAHYLERLSDIKIVSYDRMMSINEMYIKDYFNTNKDKEHMEFEGKYELEDLLDPKGSAPWGEVEKENISEEFTPRLPGGLSDETYPDEESAPYYAGEPTEKQIEKQLSGNRAFGVAIESAGKAVVELVTLIEPTGLLGDVNVDTGKVTFNYEIASSASSQALDLINKGEYKSAGLSGAKAILAMLAMIPVIGKAVKLTNVGSKVARKRLALATNTIVETSRTIGKELRATGNKTLIGEADKIEQQLLKLENKAIRDIQNYVASAGTSAVASGISKRASSLLSKLLESERLVKYSGPVYRGLRANNIKHFQKQFSFDNPEAAEMLAGAYQKALNNSKGKWVSVDLSGKGVSVVPKAGSEALSFSKSKKVAKHFSDFRLSLSHSIKNILGIPTGKQKMQIVVTGAPNPEKALDVGKTLELKNAVSDLEDFMKEAEVLVIQSKIPIQKIMFKTN